MVLYGIAAPWDRSRVIWQFGLLGFFQAHRKPTSRRCSKSHGPRGPRFWGLSGYPWVDPDGREGIQRGRMKFGECNIKLLKLISIQGPPRPSLNVPLGPRPNGPAQSGWRQPLGQAAAIMVHDGRAPKCCGAFPPQQEVPKGADLYTVYFAHLRV